MTDAPQGPTVFNDRYELHRKLARGGMSDVYLARDLLLDRPVAVKVLFTEYARDPNFVERFRREAQAAANLIHPNIVNVYDWGQQSATYFIVMEYVEGRSLSEIIRTEGPIHPDRAAEITADVAAALGFAHRNGVVHRDIKPGNILITSTGQVKVADFGIAQAVNTGEAAVNLTQAGSVMGTATYFSPEQAQGKAVDPRSDLYSLGCVLFESLTTRPPFQGDTPVAIAYKHVQEQPPTPRSVVASIPVELEAIDLKLLAKSPANRYASAEDLRSDLRRFLEGQPVLAMGAVAAGAAAAGVAAGAAAAALASDATMAVPSSGSAVVPPGGGSGPDGSGGQPPSDDRPGSKRSGVYLAVLIALLVVLAGVLVVLGVQLNRSGKQVTVPEVTTLKVEDAVNKVTAVGLKPETKNEPNGDVPTGVVFDQTPKGGSKADKGDTVVLRVSGGVAQVEVPDVVGRQESAARSLLENANFVVEVNKQSDPTVEAGKVISQNPGAKQQADKGSVVTIAVSSGPAPVAIPDVSGDDASSATNQLTALGFKVTQKMQSSTSVGVGKVISTDPAIGTEQSPGTTVVLIVSSGPSTTTSSSTTSSSSSTTTTTKAPTTTSTS